MTDFRILRYYFDNIFLGRFESLRLSAIALYLAIGVAVFAIDPEPVAVVQRDDFETSEYLRFVQKADEAIAKSRWSEAIEYFRAAMASDPSNPQNVLLLSNVGMMQFYQGLDSLALHTLSEARVMAPNSVVILRNRARVLEGMGRIDDALKDYDKVLAMDSTYTDALADRAMIFLRLGRIEEAERDVTQLMNQNPNDRQGLLMSAVIYSSLAKFDDAIKAYGRLIALQPEAVYYSARAFCYLETDQLPEAAEDIAIGLQLDPDDSELYICRALLNRLRYREVDAKADVATALKKGASPERLKALGF